MLLQNSELQQFYQRPVIIWTFAGAAILKGVSYFCIPFMTIFLFQNSKLPPYMIGMLVGMYQFGSIIASFFSGIISDRIGRRLVLLIGLYGSAFIYTLFFIFATFIKSGSGFPIIFGCLNIMAGIAHAMFWPTTYALISDQLQSVNRLDHAAVFRHYYIMINFGSAIAPPVSTYLGIASERSAFVISSICYFVSATLFLYINRNIKFTINPSSKTFTVRKHINKLANDRTFVLLILSIFLFVLGYSQIDSNLSYIIVNKFENGTQFFAMLFPLNALCVFIFQPVVTVLNKHLSFRQMIMFGSLLLSFGCMPLYVNGYTKSGVIFLLIIGALAESLVIPIANAMIDEIAPKKMRGSYFSAATLRNLGKMVGPVVGGSVIVFWGQDYLFIFMGLCGFTASLVIYFSLKIKGQEADIY